MMPIFHRDAGMAAIQLVQELANKHVDDSRAIGIRARKTLDDKVMIPVRRRHQLGIAARLPGTGLDLNHGQIQSRQPVRA